jgi:hypothetical protein
LGLKYVFFWVYIHNRTHVQLFVRVVGNPQWMRMHTLAVTITNHFLFRRPTPFQSVFDSTPSFHSLSANLILVSFISSHFTFHNSHLPHVSFQSFS